MVAPLMALLVGFDAREAFRENPRGIGLYCRHLLREFGELAPEARFLAYHERPTPRDLPTLGPNIEPRLCTMRGDRWHAWERLRMPWQIARDRVDLYHGTYNTLPPRWPLLRSPPLVVSLHDVIVTWWPDDERDSYVRYCRAVTARVVRQATRILTVSEWSRRDIAERYRVPVEKIDIFWNGVHPEFLRDPPPEWQDRAKRRFAGQRPYLFAIGSPLRRKNTAGLLAAIGILVRQGDFEHDLVITGLLGAGLVTLRDIAHRHGIAERVQFHGYVDREELIGLYRGADLTVYPSHAEGWGIPVVESLACGTPVATSNTTAMPEAGGEFAHYFDPAQPEDMAAVIAKALREREAFAAKRPAAQQRARGFTWRRAAAKTLAVYREVIR
jgi:glycosyltransferase involved in cell wall biosynthesis